MSNTNNNNNNSRKRKLTKEEREKKNKLSKKYRKKNTAKKKLNELESQHNVSYFLLMIDPNAKSNITIDYSQDFKNHSLYKKMMEETQKIKFLGKSKKNKKKNKELDVIDDISDFSSSLDSTDILSSYDSSDDVVESSGISSQNDDHLIYDVDDEISSETNNDSESQKQKSQNGTLLELDI